MPPSPALLPGPSFPPTLHSYQNERFEESVDRAAREGKDMNNTLAVVEKAGNLTIAEEDQLRSRLEEMEEALEKEHGNERAIEDKIKARLFSFAE